MSTRRLCLDCQALTDTPILTHAVERASGPPWTAYACPDCAPRHLSTEQAMSLLFNHTAFCEECNPIDSCAQGWALSRVVGRALRRRAPEPAEPPPAHREAP